MEWTDRRVHERTRSASPVHRPAVELTGVPISHFGTCLIGPLIISTLDDEPRGNTLDRTAFDFNFFKFVSHHHDIELLGDDLGFQPISTLLFRSPTMLQSQDLSSPPSPHSTRQNSLYTNKKDARGHDVLSDPHAKITHPITRTIAQLTGDAQCISEEGPHVRNASFSKYSIRPNWFACGGVGPLRSDP